MFRVLLPFIFSLFTASLALAADCPEGLITTPAPVEIEKLKTAVYALEDINSKKLFMPSPIFEKEIENTFDLKNIKTKMEQFYTLLWIFSQELAKQKHQQVSLSQKTVENVLIASKVFTDPKVPSQIQTIRFDLTKSDRPKYFVTFQKAGTEIPLNNGEGFYLLRNGKCQHALRLIFESTFTFEMKRNLGNLMVTNFKGVDLFGDFGNRGIVDVDIQYVTLKSVEFFTGTVNGRVVAYVSREEFKKNEHSSLLKILTRIVPDRSVQPIDW
jgi:hypothetical protein